MVDYSDKTKTDNLYNEANRIKNNQGFAFVPPLTVWTREYH